MVLTPKESGEFIAKNSTHVQVNDEGCKKLAKKILEELIAGNIKIGDVCESECYPKGVSNEVAVDWLFMLDAVNFCFWSAERSKWLVKWKGKTYSGYFALCAAVARALEEGINMTDPKVYSKLTEAELKQIFRSETSKEIPLLSMRVDCLHEVGEKLLTKYNGSFVNCVKTCDKSAQKLLKLITEEFPCFNDLALYKNQEVSFHKRAQIVLADLWCQFEGKGYGEFTDMDSITMFADYRVPQPMVEFGALTYSDSLMKTLNQNTILENGSESEVEIRGCSIEAVERIKGLVDEMMKEKNLSLICNATVIDNYLWLYRRKNADRLEAIPFHKVLSIYY